MSGVIIDGQQWEHCNVCAGWVKFPQNLGYVKPSATRPGGLDICAKCVDAKIKSGDIHFDEVRPAPSWAVYEVVE